MLHSLLIRKLHFLTGHYSTGWSYSLDWPLADCAAKDGFELLILLPLPSKGWDYRYDQSHPLSKKQFPLIFKIIIGYVRA